ncbi:MAG: polysaccharide biosynthesis/export family protein, partial [Pseudomonadota bacterium]
MRRIAFMLFVSALLSSCGSNPVPPEEEITKGSDVQVDEYRIGVSDVLQINVWRNADLTTAVPVRPDGMISVPLAGEVLAAGSTPQDLADKITEELGVFLRNPQVSVIVT